MKHRTKHAADHPLRPPTNQMRKTAQRAEFVREAEIGNLEEKVNASYRAQNAQRFPPTGNPASPVQRSTLNKPDVAGILRHEHIAKAAAPYAPAGSATTIQRLKTISQVVPPNVHIKPRDAMLRYIEYLSGEAKVVGMKGVMAKLAILTNNVQQADDYDYNGEFIKGIHDKLSPLKEAIIQGPVPKQVDPPKVDVPDVEPNIELDVPEAQEQNELQELPAPVLEEVFPTLDIADFETADSFAEPIEEKALIVDGLLEDAYDYEDLDFTVAQNRIDARKVIDELLEALSEVSDLVVKFDQAMETFDDAFDKGQFSEEDIEDANALHTSFHSEHNHVIKTREAHLDIAITELRGDIEINIETATQQQAATQELINHRGDWRTPALAKGHFIKHKADTGYGTEIEYLKAARALTTSAPSNDILQKISGSDTLFFKKSTGEFAVKAADNYIRTFFKPDQGQYYYTKQ